MAGPESFKQQYALWVRQRGKRIELGDDLAEARPVEHFAYFMRGSRARDAAATLRAAGFDVETGRRGLKVLLKATRPQRLGDEEVAAFLAEVIGAVEQAHGDYDGWGATTS
ncbi:ribonuclease E inhibitor RraB [Isoptericola haloaureus]|uniref:Ribonuclease E inhibitor RraB n=1 Tax=Isoptericola haloaureus TaxID=1542902 RepID=A0ABU7Z3N7_9MICO